MAGAHPTISSLASTGWQNCSKHRATHQSESFLLHLLTSKLISIGGKYINIHTHTRIHTHTYIYVFMCYIHIPVYIHTYIKIKGCNTKSRYFFFWQPSGEKPPNTLMKAKICCFWNSLSFTLAQQTCNLPENYMQEEVPRAKLPAISSSSATDDSAFCFDYSRKHIACWTAPPAFYHKYAVKHQQASKECPLPPHKHICFNSTSLSSVWAPFFAVPIRGVRWAQRGAVLCTHTKPLWVLADQAYALCQWRYHQDFKHPTRIPAYVITFNVTERPQLRIQLLTALIGKLGLATHSCSNAGNTCMLLLGKNTHVFTQEWAKLVVTDVKCRKKQNPHSP